MLKCETLKKFAILHRFYILCISYDHCDVKHGSQNDLHEMFASVSMYMKYCILLRSKAAVHGAQSCVVHV